MKLLRWSITIAAVIVVVGSGWFGVKQYDCKQRNAAFARRIASIKHEAHEQLKIGTEKAGVARFYTEHKIPFEVVSWPFKDGGSEAIGTLYTMGGCAPLGCRTDRALIGVRVKVDADGVVVAEPEVVKMYADCL